MECFKKISQRHGATSLCQQASSGTISNHSTGYFLFTPPSGALANSTVNNYRNFSVSNDSQATVVNYSESFLTGTIIGSPELGYNFSSDAIEALVNITETPDGTFYVGFTDIPTLIGNLTKNLNIQMRQAADIDSSVIGTACRTETYVSVRWQWLSFPFILLVLTLVFLVTTILKNTKSEILPWKSSTTALLLHELTAEHHEKHADCERQDEMDTVAKDLKIKLQKTNDEWQLKWYEDKKAHLATVYSDHSQLMQKYPSKICSTIVPRLENHSSNHCQRYDLPQLYKTSRASPLQAPTLTWRFLSYDTID